MWLQNILIISNHIFFFRVDFEIEVRWVVEIVSPPLFNCKNLTLVFWGVSVRLEKLSELFWVEIISDGRCDFLSARSDREYISCFWESCVSEYWKKRKVFGQFLWQKVRKMGRLLKILKVLWYFYFATHVQFLVGSLTKQVVDMERVSHRPKDTFSLFLCHMKFFNNVFKIIGGLMS